MKVLIAAVLVACVVCVIGEHCSNHNDCVQHGLTKCASSHHVACNHHYFFQGSCECTDGPSGTPCSSLSDCPACTGMTNRRVHCVDEYCTCTRA